MTARVPRGLDTVRRGFTLLEMLVVIGIMMTLLGLSIGAIMHTPKLNAMVATEHMVADAIRQARHTARSSGAPVMVEVRKAERAIMGISQITLYNDTFEATAPKLAARPPSPADIPPVLLTMGVTGRGLLTAPVSSDGSLEPFIMPTPQQKNLQLYRANGGRIEGFYLACAVYPAAVGAARYPLVFVGGSDQATTTCGIALRTITRRIQVAPGATIPGPPPFTKIDQKPAMTCLDVYGWIRDDAGTVTYVSADMDAPSGVQADIDVSAAGERDVAGPMMAGEWSEIGMMFDGTNLELYRNGILVGQKAVTVAKLYAGDNSIRLGYGDFSDGLTPAIPPGIVYLQGSLDDALLQRLGVDRAGILPAGMEPAQDYYISVHPDGRVVATSATTLRFNSTSGTDDHVDVTVGLDGTVTSASVNGP
ncbi:MAG: prepilin-type N-terminal cleavage/methylation domain-containing protein [Planctomycetes bacterium]|nr:prepilin-type N-terminal cleavage/methylation domain-containing protein [Planctomycetota bacterium]